MKIAGMIAVVAVMVAGFGMGGCEQTGKRVDSDKELIGDRGLQSRDLREMTDRMAPDLLQIPEISRNPYKVVVVMKPIESRMETDPGRDLTIYVARLKTLLNGAQSRDSRRCGIIRRRSLGETTAIRSRRRAGPGCCRKTRGWFRSFT
jgi:hypothetical protein